MALSVSEEAGNEIEKGCIMERPKVIYNKRTKKFVMWFHLELKGKGYEAARAGVAVSDSPTGPYCFVSSSRVCPGIRKNGTCSGIWNSLKNGGHPSGERL